MRRRLLTAVVAGAVLALAVPTAADAAGRPTGIDVSFPQCDGALPAVGDFAVVGVDNGVATQANPCLATELAWAAGSPGTVHSRVDVYVNTANPNRADASFAPTGDATKRGRKVTSPYGHCRDETSRACSWVYGASLAWDDVETSGVTGSVGRWWLDIESINSWSTSTTRNRAALEGMVAAFTSAHKSVGLYSSAGEFHDIVGSVPSSSSLSKLPSWIAAGTTQGSAERLCSHVPLTKGRLTLTQWRDTTAKIDRDVACAVLTKAPKPKISGHYRVGKKLTAKPGTWGPGSVHLAYRWTRDGHDIAKATHKTYTLKKADKRHRIALTITATETGYSRSVKKSASHRIAS
jgi:hypothetical protein